MTRQLFATCSCRSRCQSRRTVMSSAWTAKAVINVGASDPRGSICSTNRTEGHRLQCYSNGNHRPWTISPCHFCLPILNLNGTHIPIFTIFFDQSVIKLTRNSSLTSTKPNVPTQVTWQRLWHSVNFKFSRLKRHSRRLILTTWRRNCYCLKGVDIVACFDPSSPARPILATVHCNILK